MAPLKASRMYFWSCSHAKSALQHCRATARGRALLGVIMQRAAPGPPQGHCCLLQGKQAGKHTSGVSASGFWETSLTWVPGWVPKPLPSMLRQAATCIVQPASVTVRRRKLLCAWLLCGWLSFPSMDTVMPGSHMSNLLFLFAFPKRLCHFVPTFISLLVSFPSWLLLLTKLV